LSAQGSARPAVARARSGSRRVNIPQKEVGEVWRIEDFESELQLALLPENEVLPSVQINLFARLAPAEYYARTGQNGMCWWAAG
jgi:hypothetical protein